MSADNGGPAFPTREKIGETFDDYTGKWHDEFGNFGGLTIRDYFAAKAMQGDIASMVDPIGERCGLQMDLPDENLSSLADLYYRMADAMLKERDK